MDRRTFFFTFTFLLTFAVAVVYIFSSKFMPRSETPVTSSGMTEGPTVIIKDFALSDKTKTLLGGKLRKLALNLQELQHKLANSLSHYRTVGNQLEMANEMLRLIEQDTVKEANSSVSNAKSSSQKKQEICPEKFVGKDLGYGAPYYRLGFARVDCKEFVPMPQLITLLMYAPKEFPKPSMSYLEMMQGVEKYYQENPVILATSAPVSAEAAFAISKLKIKFNNEVFKDDTKEGEIWAKLLEKVETPYVLIAPRITHFDDDVDLHRLVRMLSYNDDVAVAGGSYRNVTAHWDLGCRQVSFTYWTAKYSSGYYRSFNECVVCDYLPGPFAAKTQLLKKIKFDSSLSKGVFHDLFWRLKRLESPDNVAVVCADVMFNIDAPKIPDADYAPFANKHEIKKMINPDGTVRWYGCKRGLSYTKGRTCSWSDGMGAPPCDLDNLGDVIRFTMTACEEGKMVCEYAAGTVLGAVKFGSVIPWEKDADIHFHTSNYSAFNRLKGKFEAAGFRFSAHPGGLGGFSVSTTRWRLSLYGRKTLEVGDMIAHNKLPTRVPMAGAWVTTPRNPGLFSRNHYVYEYFRHAEHHNGNSFYNAGAFRKCPRPGHSACLDQYPIDGNIQFLEHVP